MTTSILQEIQQSKVRTKSQEAYLALVRTADDAKRNITTLLNHSGVTLQQYNVLRILRGAGVEGLPTLTIADRMIERTPGVTRIIDRMENHGWVERRRCVEDRRRVWCAITDEGLELLSGLDAPVNAADDSLAEIFDEQELGHLIEYLDRMRAYFAEQR